MPESSASWMSVQQNADQLSVEVIHRRQRGEDEDRVSARQ
jgi:hypothetical protein